MYVANTQVKRAGDLYLESYDMPADPGMRVLWRACAVKIRGFWAVDELTRLERQSWPRGTGSVGDSVGVGEGAGYVLGYAQTDRPCLVLVLGPAWCNPPIDRLHRCRPSALVLAQACPPQSPTDPIYARRPSERKAEQAERAGRGLEARARSVSSYYTRAHTHTHAHTHVTYIYI